MKPSSPFDTASDREKRNPEHGFGPPIDLIVIGGNTPDSQRTSGFFTSPSPRRPLVGMTTPDHEYVETIPNATPGTWPSTRPNKSTQHRSHAPSGSFKLQPRNPLTSASSSSRVSTRGRKRRAHSISVPRPGMAFSDDDVEWRSNLPVDGGQASPRKNELTLSPILTMRTLSLQSPTSRHPRSSPISVPSAGLPYSRPNGSSCFSAYAGSPAGSSANMCASSSLASGISSKSSPRQIPLTILSESRSPHKTPQGHRARASLLYSLDKESPLSDAEARTPKPSCSAPVVSLSGPKAEMSSTRPGAKSNQCGSPTAASPRTPLPKKLNITPRTPSSTSHNEGRNHLPMFPSSTRGDMPDCTFNPKRDDAVSGNDKIDSEMDKLLMAFSNQAHHDGVDCKINNGVDMAFPSRDEGVGPTSRSSPRRNTRPLLGEVEDTHSSPHVMPKPCDLHTLRAKTPISTAASCIKIRSVLTPSEASGGMLAQMMEAEARAGVLDAETGSLSDSDDEEFVLAAPMGLSFDKHIQRTAHEEEAVSTEDGPVFVERARQRRRCGDKQSSGSVASNEFGASRPHSSMTSLAATSTCTSNTSLFGMDIVHEATSARTAMTSKVSSKSARDGNTPEYECSCSSHHSHQSNHSLGLCVDGSTASADLKHDDDDGTGRDLVTPPITLPAVLAAPPSLPSRFANLTTTTCADRSKVSLTIASMEAQELKP